MKTPPPYPLSQIENLYGAHWCPAPGWGDAMVHYTHGDPEDALGEWFGDSIDSAVPPHTQDGVVYYRRYGSESVLALDPAKRLPELPLRVRERVQIQPRHGDLGWAWDADGSPVLP